MPLFEVIERETITQENVYYVEAETEEEAIEKVQNAEAELGMTLTDVVDREYETTRLGKKGGKSDD